MKYILGIDIGGTKISLSLAESTTGHIHITDKIKFPTSKKGYSACYCEIMTRCKELLQSNHLSKRDLSAIGISCGGPLDSYRGIILSPPNLIGWDNVHICDDLSNEFHVPCYLQNDANACALAEWKFGAGRNKSNLVFLTFGTGFGAGLILNNQLYQGASGMSGEVGHCSSFWIGNGESFSPIGYGKSGSYEGFCSGGGIAQIGRFLALREFQKGNKVSFCSSPDDMKSITAETIAQKAFEGDSLARTVYQISAEKLGSALAMIADILNPEMIILGSIYPRTKELLEPIALRVMKDESLQATYEACEIVCCGLGEALGDYAAISTALNKISC